MDLAVRPHHMPSRLAAGAFVLNSGLSKRHADEQTEQGLHAMAAGAYPFLGRMAPHRFTRLLSSAEIALGTALLNPLVPSAVAGAALTAFSSGLFGLYLRTPGMHEPGSPRPTYDGTVLAKDTWLLGMGLSLLTDPDGWPTPRGWQCS